jgi:hypothetical protein
VQIFRRHTAFLITITILGGLIFFVYRTLLLNFATHLSDWNDYPLYVWILYQNINHLKAGAISEIFNGAIFYPNTGTLLFSDLFFPQSLIALLLATLFKNPIIVFNSIYFLAWILNIFSVYYFWRVFTKHTTVLFFVTFATIFSSFTMVNAVHFQMINFWPFFFGLGLLFTDTHTKRNATWVTVWTAIQFYSGVYLGFFMLCAIALYYLSRAGVFLQSTSRLKIINHLSVFILGTILLSGPLLYNYYQVKQQYQATRDYGEYVQYSLHFTDYFFPAHLSSLLGKSRMAIKWAQYNHAAGLFPGFALCILALYGMFHISNDKKSKQKHIAFALTPNTIFFGTALLIGFVFSLGPRLNVNGIYAEIPLPYHILLKTLPGFDIIRVTARWSWFVFIGLTYFALVGIEKRKEKTSLVAILASLLLFIETVPLQKTTSSEVYYETVYQQLEPHCQNKSVLLEYPLTQDKTDANIVTNLTYRTQLMMASIHHQCQLINGYTGYIPRDYTQFETDLYQLVDANERDRFFEILENRGVQIIKLNKNEIYAHKAKTITEWLKSNNAYQVIHEDESYLLTRKAQ